jgi:protein-S-isoprenylcysteine O-methyltransferase Ste14
MSLHDEYVESGNKLFRARGYLPLLFLPVILFTLRHYHFLAGSRTIDGTWETACVFVSLLGLFTRMMVAGYTRGQTSGRNVKEQEAGSLNTTGLYSIVRHPLYVGNFLIWLGIAAFVHSIGLILVFALAFWLYYERIMFAEEDFLRRQFGGEFAAWARRTPAFLPRLRGWRSPDAPLSWRRILKREYSSFLAIPLAFTVLDLVIDAFAGEKNFEMDLSWKVFLSFGMTSYLVLRWAKKRGLLSR